MTHTYTFISDQDYADALKNGISKGNVDQRVYNQWTIEDAITIPIGVKRGQLLSPKSINTAHDNGLTTGNVLSRLRVGWSLEDAISKPLSTRGRKRKNGSVNQQN